MPGAGDQYSKLLDRFYDTFFVVVGDVIPKRTSLNLIYLCANADDFVKMSNECEFPMTAQHEGAYMRWHGFSLINAHARRRSRQAQQGAR